MKKAAYTLFPDRPLVIETYIGTVNGYDLISVKEALKQELGYDFTHNTVIDFLDCELNIHPKSPDYFKFIAYTRDLMQNKKTRNVAYLVSASNHFVMADLYAQAIENLGLPFNGRIFTSIEQCCEHFTPPIIAPAELSQILDHHRGEAANVFETELV